MEMMGISFIDLYNSLPENDRQRLVDNVVGRMLGKTTEPFSILVSGKISTNASPEEQIKALQNIFGSADSRLENVDMAGAIAKLNENWKMVQEVMEPQLQQLKKDPKTTADKYEELTHASKFIVSTGESIVIEPQETPLVYPDFIVSYNGLRIGIEHTRLIDKTENEFIRVTSRYLDSAKDILLAQFPGATGIINITLDYNQPVTGDKTFAAFDFTKPERDSIPGMIARYLASVLNGIEVEKPVYIDRASFTPNPGISLDVIHNEQYLSKKDADNLLMKAIKAKEKRYTDYSQKQKLDEFWLLVVMDGVTASSSYKYTAEDIPTGTISNYDRIYLFDAFGSKFLPVSLTKATVQP
jgi:hypothetical protein